MEANNKENLEEKQREPIILWPGLAIVKLNHMKSVNEYLVSEGFYERILEEASPEMGNALLQKYVTEQYYNIRQSLDYPIKGIIGRLEIKYTVDGRVYGGIKISGNNIADSIEHYFFMNNFGLYFDSDGDFIARENMLTEYGYRVFFREFNSLEDFKSLQKLASQNVPLRDFIEKFNELSQPLGRHLGYGKKR